MPSDPNVGREAREVGSTPFEIAPLLERLGPALDPFRSAVAEAAEEVRLYRARHEEIAADPAGRMARELGPFAEGRIDPLRLVGLLGDGAAPDPLADRLMAVAHERFLAASSGGLGSYRTSVPDGGDLRDAVKDALAEVGSVFAIARAVEKARDRRYEPDRDHHLLHPHPFHRWSPAERSLAPPLLVEVAGAGLRGAALLEFMEGSQKFVLVVRGPSPPAPLARLASPGVFVAQVDGAEGPGVLTQLASHPGPGVVAIFQEGAGALRFVHPGEGAPEVDSGALASAVEHAANAPGQPGVLDLRYLEGLVASAAMAAVPRASSGVTPGAAEGGVGSASPEGTPNSSAPARGSSSVEQTGGATPAPAGTTPSVDQLADWLLARTAPAAD
jgi:hypothetical protein